MDTYTAWLKWKLNNILLLLPQEGLNIMHCAAINNHTEIIEYIVSDLQMKELDKEDKVSSWDL